ncbi:MAG: serine/threonine protein kinase [Chloroflexi bacterium]|nr:serine/threonine protein kinase [Chloroflexota bacterium]
MVFQPGEIILNEKYRVEELVGKGAFGEVYRAVHVSLGVVRAIKVLSADAPGVGSKMVDEYHQRYGLEFQLAARLHHPNVVEVYDQDRQGQMVYAVIEYAPGGSLADLLKRQKPLPIKRTVRILLDCAEGLDEIHERLEAVHRDVTPANILLGEDGRAKIGDLGLALVQGGKCSQRSRLGSAAELHPGTPNYRSPEHEGWAPLMPTSDVYSLGCVAFEMLTGQVWKWARRKVERAGELRPDLPQWLDAVVARMLCEAPGLRAADAGDVHTRYATMAQVGAALREGLEREAWEKREAGERQGQERQEVAARAQAEARRAQVAAEKAQRESEARVRTEAKRAAAKSGRGLARRRWLPLVAVLVGAGPCCHPSRETKYG